MDQLYVPFEKFNGSLGICPDPKDLKRTYRESMTFGNYG